MVALGGSRQPKSGQGVPRRVKAALDGSRWPHGGPRQHHGGPRQPLDGHRRALGRLVKVGLGGSRHIKATPWVMSPPWLPLVAVQGRGGSRLVKEAQGVHSRPRRSKAGQAGSRRHDGGPRQPLAGHGGSRRSKAGQGGPRHRSKGVKATLGWSRRVKATHGGSWRSKTGQGRSRRLKTGQDGQRQPLYGPRRVMAAPWWVRRFKVAHLLP
ncbi:hypothetical protein ACLB2K_047307 [Fragaria x ananassa]